MKTMIRSATTNDMHALDRVASAMGHKHEAGYFDRCLKEQIVGNRAIFVAMQNDLIQGYVQLNWKPLYAPFRRLDMPEVQDLCVIPAARRQGMGALLVRACEDAAREKGFRAMGISVGLDPSYGAAQRLYVRLGYIPDGTGACYDDVPVKPGELKPVDGFFTLKFTKDL